MLDTCKKRIRNLFGIDNNENSRNIWLHDVLKNIPNDLRILDAGAGELKNRLLCSHLNYVSQDFCQYEGKGDSTGLQTGTWDTSKIDIICDITNIPEPEASFDVILCSEVLEHLPDPLRAIDEFSRLLKPGGKLILTAPFASFVHFAPYHFATGFSKYWYEHHLPLRGFSIYELTSNGDWFDYLKQELVRLPAMTKKYGNWHWPLSIVLSVFSIVYLSIIKNTRGSSELACFGWQCVAIKK
ncbi:MAG: class I SAM-dependent methyltransferase [Methylophilus sp.]